MNIFDFLKDNIVLLDGAMGTMLQEAGLKPGALPEQLNLSDPERITAIHRQYYEAGSHVVLTNTFGANPFKYGEDELREVIAAGVACAGAAREAFRDGAERFVALDIGPLGRLLKPYGTLDFEDAVAAFAAVVRAGAAAGADLIMIETMTDSYETKAALLAAKENSSLPVFVSNAYGADGKLMTGASPTAMAAMLEGLGADVIGVNCSYGPDVLAPVAAQYLADASIPVLLKPNAGIPKVIDGKTVYDIGPEPFAASVAELVKKGVRVIGGCCGTTPAYIRALAAAVEGLDPVPVRHKTRTLVSSYTHAVDFAQKPILIGERINPTGKKRFKQALMDRDIGYILQEGIRQEENGAQILDVNVGLPGIDEAELLKTVVCELQAVTDLPLQLDTADPKALEAALRVYNGKPLINSVNGKKESIEAVFPLVKKYGGAVIALTLDENGIPRTAAERVAIAGRLIEAAASYGIDRKDLIFDPLTMTVSAEPQAALVTLEAVEQIGRQLGCHTSLGVSNVSFGLPAREMINSTFFAMALERGLSAAILNVNAPEMMKTWYSFRVLHGLDENCMDYVAFAPRAAAASAAAAVKSGGMNNSLPAPGPKDDRDPEDPRARLRAAIVRGLREQAASLTASLLTAESPLTLIDEEIIPALDAVGKSFEEKRTFLPQLLMSAEAAAAAFEQIKASLPQTERKGTKCRVVIATVQGDIHDIGKNIVKLLLENYGFDVIDLGKDVPPSKIVREVRQSGAPLVGLSALMTTTVPAMEETIRLLREEVPACRIIVGGAVLTADYAAKIGADAYGKDAMDTVRFAERVNEEQ